MEVNPYAPPSEINFVGSAPESSGWELREGALWVKRDAILPMVDLYSGGHAEQMTLMRIAVRRRIRWHLYLCLVGIGLLAVPRMGAEYVSAVSGFMILGLITGLTQSAFAPVAFVQVFLTKETLRRERLRRGWVAALVVFATLVLFLSAFANVAPQSGRVFAVVVGVLFFGSLLLAVVLRQWGRRLFHRGRNGDWFEVGGVHPGALGELEAGQGRGR